MQTFKQVVMNNTCRYCNGDPKTDKAPFCGEERQRGSSYCPEHHELCHRPAREPPEFLADFLDE